MGDEEIRDHDENLSWFLKGNFRNIPFTLNSEPVSIRVYMAETLARKK